MAVKHRPSGITDDPLSTARGITTGVVIGLVLWTLIIAVIVAVG